MNTIVENNYLNVNAAFRLGRYFESINKVKKAREYYEYSSDNSIRIGRIHTSLLRYIKGIPNVYPNVKMIDLCGSLKKKLNVDFLDDSFFTDWCHLTPESSYLIAREIAENIKEEITDAYGSPENPPPDYESCLDIAIADKQQFFDHGYQEAGFSNIQFHRWEQAIFYYNKVSYKENNIKVAMGLFLANAQSGNTSEAEELLQHIKKRWSVNEFAACIETYYKFERNYLTGMFKREE